MSDISAIPLTRIDGASDSLADHKGNVLLVVNVASKCGLMVGIGETKEEVFAVLDDLRAHNVELITIGQYLQPSKQHAPVERFVTPAEFEEYAAYGRQIGFRNIWSGPLVRSSYHANRQFDGPCESGR